MVKIKKSCIYEKNDNFNCEIEYTIIQNLNDDLFIEYINKKILDDILIFKEISLYESLDFNIKNSIFIDFKEHFNKNNIISLSIVFSNIYDTNKIINYINTYNFDVKHNRELLISDIFNRTDLIEEYINKDFYLTKDYISMVFSSYENKNTSDLDEVRIYFKDNKENITEYIKSYIME